MVETKGKTSKARIISPRSKLELTGTSFPVASLAEPSDVSMKAIAKMEIIGNVLVTISNFECD